KSVCAKRASVRSTPSVNSVLALLSYRVVLCPGRTSRVAKTSTGYPVGVFLCASSAVAFRKYQCGDGVLTALVLVRNGYLLYHAADLVFGLQRRQILPEAFQVAA